MWAIRPLGADTDYGIWREASSSITHPFKHICIQNTYMYLKLQTVNSFVATIDDLLIHSGPSNWSYSAINENKALRQR